MWILYIYIYIHTVYDKQDTTSTIYTQMVQGLEWLFHLLQDDCIKIFINNCQDISFALRTSQRYIQLHVITRDRKSRVQKRFNIGHSTSYSIFDPSPNNGLTKHQEPLAGLGIFLPVDLLPAICSPHCRRKLFRMSAPNSTWPTALSKLKNCCMLLPVPEDLTN